MYNNHSIGIGIYVFNGEKYINKALESIKNQTIQVDKIFISDNCSTDNSVKIIKEFAEKNPIFSISVNVNEKNLGFLKNAEKVINMADTDYLLLLHVDDYLLNNSIEILINEHINHPDLALVGGKNHVEDYAGNRIYTHEKGKNIFYDKGNIYEFVKEQFSYLPFSGVLHKTNVLKDVGFDFSSNICDELYWPKVLLNYPILVLGDVTVVRTSHNEQTTFTYARSPYTLYSFYKEHIGIIYYELRLKKRQQIKRLLQQNYSDKMINLAIIHLKKFSFTLFIKAFFYALSIKPNFLISNNTLYRKLAKKLK